MKMPLTVFERISKDKVKELIKHFRSIGDEFTAEAILFNVSKGFLSMNERIACTQLYEKQNKCEVCGFIGKTIIHHIIPTNIRPELAYDTNNMVELCYSCHRNEHYRLNSYYSEQLSELSLITIEEMEQYALEKRGLVQQSTKHLSYT